VLAVLAMCLFSACASETGESSSSGQPAPAESAAPSPSEVAAPIADNFAGPVVWTCTSAERGENGVTRVEKWNLATGERVETNSLPGCRASGIPGPARSAVPFPAQRALQFLDPTQTKQVRTLRDNHVGFVDLASGKTTDVTELLVPAVDDFGVSPNHTSPLFAPNGEFVFFDRTIVRTQNHFPSSPDRALAVSDDQGFIGPAAEVEAAGHNFVDILGHAVCGNAVWWLNDREYLTERAGRLELATFGGAPSGAETCGPPLTPETKIQSAVAGPDGRVYFMMAGPNGANRADPDSPRKIQMNVPFEETTSYMFAGWS
jgi:hypothetical protein